MPDFSMNVDYGKPQGQMSLGDIMNLARGAQAYQQAEQVNPLALQKAQMEVQQAQQLNPLAVQKAKAETTTAEIGTKAKQLELDQSHFNLAGNLLSGLESRAATLAKSGDKETALKELKIAKQWMTLSGIPEKENGPFKVAENALNDNDFPSYLNTLENMKNTLAGASSRFQAQQMSPTGYRDPTGAPTAYVKSPSGQITSEVAIPTPNNQAVTRMPFETDETLAAARNIQLQANKSAQGVQTSQYNNNKIVQLADKALVGANAETLAKLGGGYAVLPWSSDATQNRQILGHQMALETANLAGNAGLGTDAARGLAEKMAGTTEWTPDAIKATARMNRALTTGSDMFNRGVNAAVSSAGNNPIAAREFQNKWSSQEQLVPTLQFVDALRNAKDDPAGAKSAVDAVGGYGSKGYKEMLQRAGRLNDLITKGQ